MLLTITKTKIINKIAIIAPRIIETDLSVDVKGAKNPFFFFSKSFKSEIVMLKVLGFFL